MQPDKAGEIKAQLDEVDKETEEMQELSYSISEMEDKLLRNSIIRKRLKKNMIDTGYRI